jgi:dCMP deaminase
MANTRATLPDFPEYYMSIAFAVRKRANCKGFKVGAVLVVKNRVVSTGYNGVPEGMTNCLDGGCDRCGQPEKYQSGVGYDVCICVHAEENALLSAARFGMAVDRATIYTTVKPCFGCMKELHQAGVEAVRFHKEWTHPDAGLASQYRALENKFSAGVKRVELQDVDDPVLIYPPKSPKS